MELQESFNMLFEVGDDDSEVGGGQNEGGKPREKDRDSIKPFHTHAGSWVGSVSFSKTSIEKSKDGASMGR